MNGKIKTFKAGDRLKVIGAMCGGPAIGDIVIAKRVDANNVWLHDEGHPCDGWLHNRFEAAPKRDYVADHARRTLRAAGLTKEQAAKFVANMVAQPEACDVRPSAISRKLPRPLKYFIYDAFIWGSSNEGFDYWNDISVKLNKEATANA